MTIVLNAFPLKVPKNKLIVHQSTYDESEFNTLRYQYRETHTFRRQGLNVLIFSKDGASPISGVRKGIDPQENLNIFCFLVKDGLIRFFRQNNRISKGFNPIELVSTKSEDNLLKPILGENYPFQILVKYTIDTRLIQGSPFLIIDATTRNTLKYTCDYFINSGFDLTGRAVTIEQEDNYRKFVGNIYKFTDNELYVKSINGEIKEIDAGKAYLDANIKNFSDYLSHTHKIKKDTIIEKVRKSVSLFNNGENKKNRIEKIKTYLQSKSISLITGDTIELHDALNIENQCEQMQKPVFVFNDNGQTDWAEKGLQQYGPYTKRTFDRNDPSICIICGQNDKGRIEQFIRKLLKGIPSSKYFKNGIEGKFSLGTSRVELFTVTEDNVYAYKAAIETAIRKKNEDGGRWDLALIQVRQSFKKLDVQNNPYYIGKSLFFLHQIPVQDFTIELLSQTDFELGYSLNNMGIACYAKMGGIPWLLKSSPTLSHELVIGIGSANIKKELGTSNQRIMGITTVFSGDGSYIVSNTSKAVTPDAYCNALTVSIGETIEKIQKRMNWQQGDTIRLIFHAQVKKFNKDEIEAVRKVIKQYQSYNIEYAFLKISEEHGINMFDFSTSKEKKGRLAPNRGTIFRLSNYEMLIYLIGHRELRQVTDGHPRGLIISVHKDSTFKDIKYLSSQLYCFASHSWRSYFPNPLPVTITYSDLIARNLGWLNQLPDWNDSIMIGKIGQSQWFL